MTTAVQRDQQRDLATQARARFLALIRDAAMEFAAGAPLSVPRQQQQQAVDRVVTAFRAAAARDSKFYEATPASIGRSIALCALTGLMPGGPLPEVDLIPRQRRVKDEATGRWGDGPVELNWQIGWRGYVTLAARAGCRARPVPVYDGELFTWREGLNRTLEHTPDPTMQEYGEWEQLLVVYVVAQYRDGFRDFEVLDRRAIEKRRDRSDSWRSYQKALAEGIDWKIERAASTPWVEWAIEMARKTAMRYAGSRGLLAFDEPGQYAFEEDARADVIDAEPEVDRRPLPSQDLLLEDQGDERIPDQPRRGMAAVGAAAARNPGPAPASAPVNQSTPPSSQPAASEAPPASEPAAHQTGEAPASGGPSPSRPDPEQEQRDKYLATIKELEAQVPAATKDGLRTEHGLMRIFPRTADLGKLSRLVAGLRAAVAAQAEESSPAEPEPEPADDWDGPTGQELVDECGELLRSVEPEQRAACLAEAGIPQIDGAPELALRKLLVALMEVIPVEG